MTGMATVAAPEHGRGGGGPAGPVRTTVPAATTAEQPVVVAALVTRLERLAAAVWDGLATVAETDAGAATLAVRDGSGWSAIDHLVAAQHDLVRASRRLSEGEAPTGSPADSGPPSGTTAVSPLLQITWVVRACHELGREVAGAPRRLPVHRLQAVTAGVAAAESHAAAALRAVDVAAGM